MAVTRLAQSCAAILILAPSTRAFAGDRDCTPDTRRRARLVIENHTPCPVAIYFDDRFMGDCESMMTLSLTTRRTGDILATARSRCDTWGPVTLTLRAGQTTRWSIGYESVDGASMRACDAMSNSLRRDRASGDQFQQVLGRHEDEDSRNQGDADDLRRDLHLDADGLAANLLQDQKQEQAPVDDG